MTKVEKFTWSKIFYFSILSGLLMLLRGEFYLIYLSSLIYLLIFKKVNIKRSIISNTEIPRGTFFLCKNNNIGKVSIAINVANKNGIMIGLAIFIPVIMITNPAHDII